MKVWLSVLLFIFAFALQGCSTVNHQTTLQKPMMTSQQVAIVKQWSMDGQMAFSDTKTHHGFSAALHWQNRGLQNQIEVIGPLGLWRANLSDSQGAALLALSDGRQFQAESIEALMRANLDWYLPTDPLHYWLFAIPQPKVIATVQKDDAGRVSEIRQAGWQVNYQEYQVIDGYTLPKRIRLSKDSLQMVLIIQHWQMTL